MLLYSVLSKYYEEIFPYENEYLEFIFSVLPQNEKKPKILDIGCATGSLSLEMAKKGFHIYAFDMNKVMIEKAQKRKDEGKKQLLLNEFPIFSVLDMRKIGKAFKNDFFDSILCFGNTLVHINNNDMDQVFADIKKKLTYNGIFCLQILNYDLILKKAVNAVFEFPVIDTQNIIFKRYNKIVANNLQFYTEIYVKNEKKSYRNKVTIYPIGPDQIVHKLKHYFSEVKLYDDFDLSSFTGTALPIVIVAK